jgi:hypothetical protein
MSPALDDRMVIMGSGDEILFRFRASGLPALPDRWKRDFLLLVDGGAKDNTSGPPVNSFVAGKAVKCDV